MSPGATWGVLIYEQKHRWSTHIPYLNPLPLMGAVRTTEYLSVSPAPGEHLLVTWKEITLSPLPALFTASHLYKADTLAAWITRVLTVCEKNKSQAINNGAYVYAHALRLKLSTLPPHCCNLPTPFILQYWLRSNLCNYNYADATHTSYKMSFGTIKF